MDIAQIRAPIADDLQAVNALIRRELHSDVVLINQLASYVRRGLVEASGCGRSPCCWRRGPVAMPAMRISLLPPSLSSSTPRPCCTMTWSMNPACAVAGKPPMPYGVIRRACWWVIFFYSRSFQMVDIGSMRVMEILADTTNTIAEGEVLQLLNCHDADTSEERYMAVIHSKTAKLFEALLRNWAPCWPVGRARRSWRWGAMACIWGLHSS